MHRSGTSYLTSVLQAAGVRVGERLLAADGNNPRGYFEDADFYDLHLRMVHACTRDEPGFRDWGWTESEEFDGGRLPAFRDAARQLIDRRRGQPGSWGWKDPRNSLLLDFWQETLTEAGADPGYLMIYRPPWDVADAMQRLHVDVFLEHPEYAYRIWAFYNRRLLEFHRRNRGRSVLVAIQAVLAEPAKLAAVLAAKLGLRLDAALTTRLYAAGELAICPPDDPLVGLVAATSPQAVRLLDEMDRHADLASPAGAGPRPLPRPARRAPARGEDPPPAAVAVSVVVLCLDQGDDLVEAVASAERNAPGCEVIVADAGSCRPRTLEVLAALRGAGYQVIGGGEAGDGGDGISAGTTTPGMTATPAGAGTAEAETATAGATKAPAARNTAAAACSSAAARNAAIRRARGSYFLSLDAAERLRGGFVAAAVRQLDAESGAGAVYAGHRELGHRATSVEAPELGVDRLLCGNVIPSCAMVRKAAWEACGGYDEELGPDADWDLWLAMTERGWQLRRIPGLACDRHRRARGGTASAGEAAASGDAAVSGDAAARGEAPADGATVAASEAAAVGEVAATGDAAVGGKATAGGVEVAPLPEAILRKHQALYLQRLPELLAALVRATKRGSDGGVWPAAAPAAPAAAAIANGSTAVPALASPAAAPGAPPAGTPSNLSPAAAAGAPSDAPATPAAEATGSVPAAPAGGASAASAAPDAQASGGPPAALGAAEREGLHREIAAWRDRVAFMESTRAWRLRQRLLRLKRWLR